MPTGSPFSGGVGFWSIPKVGEETSGERSDIDPSIYQRPWRIFMRKIQAKKPLHTYR